jgi:hypothetical protein
VSGSSWLEAAVPSSNTVLITLSDAERVLREGWAARRQTVQGLAQRARIVLVCAEPGARNTQLVAAVAVSRPTVATGRRRLAEHEPDGLPDALRPGAPRTIDDQAVERLITLMLETQPDQTTPWSTRSMAARAGMSPAAVSRIWRAFGLAPHRHEAWKLSTDPLFVDKVRDSVGPCMSPPDHALVLRVDESWAAEQINQIQATGCPSEPMKARSNRVA